MNELILLVCCPIKHFRFYSRLITARNRIKAIEAASAAMTANLLDNSNSTATTSTSTTTPSSSTVTTSTSSESPLLNPPDSIKSPLFNPTYTKASSNNNFDVVLRRYTLYLLLFSVMTNKEWFLCFFWWIDITIRKVQLS